MSKLKRYDFHPGGFGQCDSGCAANMVRDINGEWVLYEDIPDVSGVVAEMRECLRVAERFGPLPSVAYLSRWIDRLEGGER